MMIQKVNLSTTKDLNQTSFSSRRNRYNNETQYVDSTNILRTMSYMGLIALVGIGLYQHKKVSDANKLVQMTNLNKAITASNVYSSSSRNSAVVSNYYRDVAKTKFESAQYKLKNGFFTGKTPKEISYIKNNIANLKAQAHLV